MGIFLICTLGIRNEEMDDVEAPPMAKRGGTLTSKFENSDVVSISENSDCLIL